MAAENNQHHKPQADWPDNFTETRLFRSSDTCDSIDATNLR